MMIPTSSFGTANADNNSHVSKTAPRRMTTAIGVPAPAAVVVLLALPDRAACCGVTSHVGLLALKEQNQRSGAQLQHLQTTNKEVDQCDAPGGRRLPLNRLAQHRTWLQSGSTLTRR